MISFLTIFSSIGALISFVLMFFCKSEARLKILCITNGAFCIVAAITMWLSSNELSVKFLGTAIACASIVFSLITWKNRDGMNCGEPTVFHVWVIEGLFACCGFLVMAVLLSPSVLPNLGDAFDEDHPGRCKNCGRSTSADYCKSCYDGFIDYTYDKETD